jgi:hypothetical protein
MGGPMKATNVGKKPILCTGLFVVTACSLAIEISLTRLFSYLYVNSYVYIIISTSMAGLGAGAVLLYFIKQEHRERYFTVLLILPVPLILFLIGINITNAGFYISLAASLLLFLSIGSTMVLIFQQSEFSIPYLYALDLGGAAFGSVLSFMTIGLSKETPICCGALNSDDSTSRLFLPNTAQHRWVLLSRLPNPVLSKRLPLASSRSMARGAFVRKPSLELQNRLRKWDSLCCFLALAQNFAHQAKHYMLWSPYSTR